MGVSYQACWTPASGPLSAAATAFQSPLVVTCQGGHRLVEAATQRPTADHPLLSPSSFPPEHQEGDGRGDQGQCGNCERELQRKGCISLALCFWGARGSLWPLGVGFPCCLSRRSRFPCPPAYFPAAPEDSQPTDQVLVPCCSYSRPLPPPAPSPHPHPLKLPSGCSRSFQAGKFKTAFLLQVPKARLRRSLTKVEDDKRLQHGYRWI